MKTRSIILMTAVAALAVTGCVSKKKYEALNSDYNSLQSQYNTTQLALTECQTGGKSLQAMLADAKKGNEDLQRNYAELQNALNQSIANNSQGNVNISKLVDEINASNKYIKQLIEAKSKSDSLNMVLTNNLTRSLSSSELQDVDVKVLKGVVYISLADNMLFRSGSYQISGYCFFECV